MTTTPSKEAREAARSMAEIIWSNLERLGHTVVNKNLQDDNALVQAFHRFQLEERERCAKVADRYYEKWCVAGGFHGQAVGARVIATAIRQQGGAGK